MVRDSDIHITPENPWWFEGLVPQNPIRNMEAGHGWCKSHLKCNHYHVFSSWHPVLNLIFSPFEL